MKYLQKIFSILLIAGMMLGWTTSGSILAKSPESTQFQTTGNTKFETQVLNQLKSGKADFFVTMTEQADLSQAAHLANKVAKGQYVFQTLVATADRSQASLQAFLDKQGIKYQSFYIVNTILVKAGSLDLANTIAARQDVSLISANHEYQLDKPMIDPEAANTPSGIESNISFVNAPQVWAMGYTGQGTVVAGNDTGLDETHPAIKAHYRGCINPPTCTTYDHNYNWWDATGTYPNDPWDGFGHGTHTTGTMVGDDGGANQIGLAPGAQTIHCKNMTDGGSGSDNTFLTCFQWDLAPWDLAHANPRPDLAPDSINNSWGYWGGGQNQFRGAINNLQAAGVLVEVSAGNEGSGCSTLRSPGDYWEVLTTGSINHAAPYPGTMTGFSSRGPSALDPSQYFPDITAPGENIRSSVPGGGYEGGWSGTSMAGPHATALVGLIWSANPALRGQVEQTIQIIRDTATPVTSYVGSCGGNYVTGPNNDWGYGTINALAAVQEAVAMGGAGQLDGHVTDATTGDPIEGANIHAAHSEGFSWDDLTDPTGFYTMTVASGTYVVTATSYGYFDEVASPVVVVTDSLTVHDFALDPLPVFTISGHVIDSVTGDPLDATVAFTDAPVPPVTTDPVGFYSLNVAQGTYHLQVTSNLHQPETREVVVNDNLTEDFLLNPLPCILVVDDDQDGPDVRSQYTTALDDLGLGYNVWDTGDDGEPAATDLAGYRHLVWFTGYPYSNTFNGTNEAAVSAYMDAGGNFFLSSQDYLYEEGLTSFGQNYLHILSFTSDVNQTTVTGQNVFSGLGPYTLNYPFTNYSDIVNPDGQALTAFTGNQGNTAVSFDGTNFNSVFFGFPFEALPTLTSRSAVMSQIVSYFGGCEPPVDVTITPSAQSQTGEPGAQVSYAYTVTNDSNVPQDITLGIASNWPAEAPTSTGELAGGASTVVTVTVTIPTMPDVIIGSDTFTLSATGVVGGYDEATGTTYANVTPNGEIIAPEGKSGKPLDLVSYEFTVTNTGNYTDSFALEVTGVWPASLPGGENTGPLAPGASTTVTVVVEIPEGVQNGDTDVTTLKITSTLDNSFFTTADVTTTAVVMHYILLPVILK